MKATNKKWWLLWGLFSASLSGYYAYALVGDDKAAYLPGETSHGHYQIELACRACHGEAFGGREGLQQACVNCHGAELKASDDSHPRRKFMDPRNADRVAVLDARACVTCHVEHKPGITKKMGVTLADDFCALCHADIAEDRPSHRDMGFETCADAGCHNYHDNKALYEDFLVKHANEPEVKSGGRLLRRNYAEVIREQAAPAKHPLSSVDANPPAAISFDAAIKNQWAKSAHARSGINCTDCHLGATAAWQKRPDHRACRECHKPEVAGFLGGKHGMRVASGMPPLPNDMARRPMRADAADKQHGCNACHGAHAVDTIRAAVDACLECHVDDHTSAYKASPHYRLWRDEQADLAPADSGVSCATCHMPRQRREHERLVSVQHNQSLNLRPNEKMIRDVCLRCHSLAFAIDALADPDMLRNNFSGRPARHVESIDMALQRIKENQSAGEGRQ